MRGLTTALLQQVSDLQPNPGSRSSSPPNDPEVGQRFPSAPHITQLSSPLPSGLLGAFQPSRQPLSLFVNPLGCAQPELPSCLPSFP